MGVGDGGEDFGPGDLEFGEDFVGVGAGGEEEGVLGDVELSAVWGVGGGIFFGAVGEAVDGRGRAIEEN